ncbi:MAG: alkaline phosphatase family protein [Planctomycetes bacterium]|nr:alkaline phosphatase family protein [Planctomycetota bacterium]
MKLLVIDAVGLRPRDLELAPRIAGVARGGFAVPLETVFPAVTSTVQATVLTGRLPREHGVVANGWYFRDLAQVFFWRQSNRLIEGSKFYETAAARDPAFRCAKLFWWFNMYAAVAYSVTPRPEYHADGLKKPGLYSEPPSLAIDLERSLGEFPLYRFWGPSADLRSTQWIRDAALHVMTAHDPDLLLAYLPHLDYDHQRFGPDHARSRAAVRDLDREAGVLIDAARARGADVFVFSEYGIERAPRPVFLNRVLHEQGFLRVQETSHGQLLDAGASRAFAVCDHQAAHVYVRAGEDLRAVQALLAKTDGVARVLDREAQARRGIDHARSGELVCESVPGAWFAYHYWLDEARRPDFAPTVDIHRKPGYDPAELFFDPRLSLPKLRAAWIIFKKALGFRYLMDVIGTDPSVVGGSHGRFFEDPERGPIVLASWGAPPGKTMPATAIAEFILARLAARS